MMKSGRLAGDKNTEDNIIKDARNLFRLKNPKEKQMMLQLNI